MATDPPAQQSSASSPSLLLLSAPPRQIGRRPLHAAYRASLGAAISRLSRQSIESGGDQASVLVVAIVGPVLVPKSTVQTGPGASAGADAESQPRVVCWKAAQALLAEVYAIVASVCAERDISAHLGSVEPGSVDVRVVLVQHDSPAEADPATLPSRVVLHKRFNGTIVRDLASFVASGQQWKTIFHCAGEQGDALLKEYLAFAEKQQVLSQGQIVAVDGGISSPAHESTGRSARPPEDKADETEMSQSYRTVCLGGTFDHLHPGHKLLLQAAALLLEVPQRSHEACTLIIGISGDELLVKKKYAEELQPWEVRARCVVAFLSTILGTGTKNTASDEDEGGGQSTGAELRETFREGTVVVRCVDIRDPFGPTVSEEDIDAIVVSGETRAGGQAINDKRTTRGWRPLDIYEIDVLDASALDDDEQGNEGALSETRLDEALAQKVAAKISSTQIRKQKAQKRTR